MDWSNQLRDRPEVDGEDQTLMVRLADPPFFNKIEQGVIEEIIDAITAAMLFANAERRDEELAASNHRRCACAVEVSQIFRGLRGIGLTHLARNPDSCARPARTHWQNVIWQVNGRLPAEKTDGIVGRGDCHRAAGQELIEHASADRRRINIRLREGRLSAGHQIHEKLIQVARREIAQDDLDGPLRASADGRHHLAHCRHRIAAFGSAEIRDQDRSLGIGEIYRGNCLEEPGKHGSDGLKLRSGVLIVETMWLHSCCNRHDITPGKTRMRAFDATYCLKAYSVQIIEGRWPRFGGHSLAHCDVPNAGKSRRTRARHRCRGPNPRISQCPQTAAASR